MTAFRRETPEHAGAPRVLIGQIAVEPAFPLFFEPASRRSGGRIESSTLSSLSQVSIHAPAPQGTR